MTSIVFIVMGAILGGEPSVPITEASKTPPPQFGIAVMTEKGGIEIRYTESVSVWQPRQRSKTFQVQDGGKWKSVSETTAYKLRLHETKQAVETRTTGEYRVFRNGAELDEKTRADLLKQPRRVVFLESGQLNWPDEFYLDLLAEDTLVVLLNVLKTPEVKVDQEKLPPATATPPAAAPPRELRLDGRYWQERLWLGSRWSDRR